MERNSEILAKLEEIRKRTSKILNNNWFFFSYFDSDFYNLSYEKVIGEFLIYSLFAKDAHLYSKVLKEKFCVESCWKKLENLSNKYSRPYIYLKPNEKLDRKWVTRNCMNSFQEIHAILNKSEVIYEDDLYRCNYLDLYNFTHDIFWGLDFGNISIESIFGFETIKKITDKAIKNYYFSVLCQHYDLASENIIVLLTILDGVDNEHKEKIFHIFNSYYMSIARPLLEKDYNFKENYEHYHMVLVLGILGNIYEYKK